MFKSKKVAFIEKHILKEYNNYYRFTCAYVKNKDDAMDIVQEAFYKAIKNVNSLKNLDYIKTWIYRIIINECKNFFSKNKIHFEDIDDVNIPVLDTYKDIDFDAMLNILNEEERLIIVLRYFEDFKLSDISSMLSINESTIKSKLYRGLKKLERSFKNAD